MLVELLVSSFVIFDGIYSKHQHIMKIIIIWIMFQNFKIGTLTKEKISHYCK
jgi:predicted Co/Zn/Cd cation transporter (cation efflux family)